MKPGVIIGMVVGLLIVGAAIGYLVFPPEDSPPLLLCMGDSLTESEFGYYPKHLRRLAADVSWPIRIETLARPGDTSGEYLEFLRTSGVLSRLEPDAVILMLGTNDVRIDGDRTPTARFRRNMEHIVSLIRTHLGDGLDHRIFIATIPPILHIDLDTFDRTSARRVEEEIVPVILDLARKYSLKVIDVNRFFKRHPRLLRGIHPGGRGYYRMARFIFSRIRKSMEAS